MTHIYYVRHAEPDLLIHDDMSRPLTEKGHSDTALVTEYLHDKDISKVYSSPYRRALDTIMPFAKAKGLPICSNYAFREREINTWVEDFSSFSKRQWQDFVYKTNNGESLSEVQKRNISALNEILRNHSDESVVIGGHGTALSTIINYFDPSFGFKEFERFKNLMPWIVHMEFNGFSLEKLEHIDLVENKERTKNG